MERAVIITYNWETQEILQTPFDGLGAKSKALAFKASIEDDFPEPEWIWVVTANEEAAEAWGDAVVDRLFSGIDEQ